MQRMTDGVASTPSDPANPGYQGGKTTDFSYDVLDREQRMRVSGSDEHDRSFTSAYWPSGDVQTRTRQQDTGPSVTESSFYFANGQLSRKERHKPDGTMDGEDATTYAYNQNGDATTDERGTHDYNARDQETSWTRAGHYGYAAGKTVSYKLDGAGQIIDSHDSVDPGSDTHYEYLAGGRLHKQTTTGGGASQTAYYCYDAFGSNTKITDQAGASGGGNCDMSATTAHTTRYWFDPFERMMKSQSADQGAQSYSYDGLDRRDTKCKGENPASCPTGQRTDYSYVGLSQNLSSQKPDGTTSTDMSMGWDYNSTGEPMGMSSKPATQTAGTQVKYMSYAKDANGSISGLEGSDGTIKTQDRYHYDPYGSLQDTSGTKPAGDPAASAEKTLTGDAQNNPMRFEGFYYDSGVKTYDMQARQYRPDTGRFLSQDRYEASQGDLNLQADPLTQNRYAFAGGNPTNNIEFDGHTGFGSFNWNQILCSIGASSCHHQRQRPRPSYDTSRVDHYVSPTIFGVLGGPTNLTQFHRKDAEVGPLHPPTCAQREHTKTCNADSPGDLTTAITLPFGGIEGKAGKEGLGLLGKLTRGLFTGGRKEATKAGDDFARRTVTALTREQESGFSAALRDPNKFHHVFDDPRHKLGPIVQELGGRDAVLREAVLAVPRGQKGIFEVTTQLGRHNLTVQGRVVDGIPRIGTLFVP